MTSQRPKHKSPVLILSGEGAVMVFTRRPLTDQCSVGTSAVTHTARPSRRGAASQGRAFRILYLGVLCCQHGCHGPGHYLADPVLFSLSLQRLQSVIGRWNPMGASSANHMQQAPYVAAAIETIKHKMLWACDVLVSTFWM